MTDSKVVKMTQFDPLWFCGAGDEAAQRQATIASAAYYRAQRRGFAPGHELEDWLAAEREVYRLIAGTAPGAANARSDVVDVESQDRRRLERGAACAVVLEKNERLHAHV